MLKAIHAQEDKAAARQKAVLVAEKLRAMKRERGANFADMFPHVGGDGALLRNPRETILLQTFESTRRNVIPFSSRWNSTPAESAVPA